MIKYSFLVETEQDIQNFVSQNYIDNNKEILLQIFTSKNTYENIKNIQELSNKYFPNAKIIGASSSGAINNNGSIDNSTLFSISIFEKTIIEIQHCEYNLNSYMMGEELISKFDINNIKNSKILISFADGLDTNGEEYLKGINTINSDIIVSGGMAADNINFNSTFVFTNDKILQKGCVGALLINPNLYVATDYNFNWQEIGERHKVNKSVKNRVYEIDGLKAIDFYKKYLGKEIGDYLPAIVLAFPLIIQKSDGFNVARAAIKDHEDGSISFAGNIEENSIVRIGFGNVNMILEKSIKSLDSILKKPIEAIYIYSCIARKRLLQKDIDSEITPLSKVADISGFFTLGEFFSYNKKNHLLNQTMTILAISENNSNLTIEHLNNNFDFDRKNFDVLCIQALSEFIKTSTNELEDLNKNLELRVKEEVEKSREKDLLLEASLRHAQLGEMMEMILHQWRQPLNALSVIVSALRFKNELETITQSDLEKDTNLLEETIRFLNTTIDDFRNFFKVGDKTENIKPSEIMSKIKLFVGHLMKKNSIKYTENIDFDGVINIQSSKFVQVLLNIVKNSVDSIIENNTKSPAIQVDIYERNDEIYFCVKDNGGGVSDDILPKIFDKRFTTKGDHHGTGIGLDMSKTIIEQHFKGNIKAINEDGGLKTIISFPKNL